MFFYITNNNTSINEKFVYFEDGSLSSRIKATPSQLIPDKFVINKELFDYNSSGLLTKYTKLDWLSNNNPNCPIEINNMFGTEWQYRYNPFNEREQKRMTYAYDNNSNRDGNTLANPYPWVYNRLGVNIEQYSVYNGYQTKIGDESFVILWAKEYNVVGAGCINAVSFA